MPSTIRSPDGTEIAYRTAGDGEPLVLVHGAATSSADWVFALPHLRERFTVVSMDRRGRGRSGFGDGGYTMEREAEDILAVLDAVGGELLVGHSYGALCSILAAERTHRLRRLVLYEPPIAIRSSRLLDLEARVAEDPEGSLEAFLLGTGTPPDQVAMIRASAAWPVLLDAMPALPRELRAGSRWENPPGPIDVPTLFLRGGDTTGEAYLHTFEALQAAFPDSRLELLPGQRHIAHVLGAEHFARTVTEFCAA